MSEALNNLMSMLNEATPFSAAGGLPGAGGPGFSDYLRRQGYDNEKSLLTLIPQLKPVDQVKLDIQLNMNGIDNFPNSGHLLVNNSKEKEGLIPIFKGKVRNPDVIKSFIPVVERSKQSHQERASNQLTGSHAWNDMWIKVYDQWLNRLYKLLGEFNGTKNGQ
jgi:hypothetical protein